MTFPSELNFNNKRKLVEALLACACMTNRQSRDQIIADLDADIRNRTNRRDDNQQDVDSLVRACLSYAQGIERLLEIVEYHEGGSIPWRRLNLLRYEISVLAVSGLTQTMLADAKQLLSLSLPAETVIKCFRQSCSDPSLIPGPEPQEAYEAFLRLFDFGALNALGFLDRLSAQLGASIRAQQLRQLAATVSDKLRLSAQFQQQHEEILARDNAPVFLLIQLLPTARQAETFTVQGWGWRDENDCRTLETNDQPCQFPAVEKIVRRLVREVEEQFETTNIVVELIFPRHLFCIDLTGWKIDVGEMEGVGSFALTYPIAFRWLNRFHARRKHQRWREKWEAVLNSLNGNGEIELEWLAYADVCTPDHLINSYVAPNCGVYLAFGFVPADKPDSNDLLTVSLNAGTPIALWFRHISEGEQMTKQVVQTLLGETRLANLPHHFRNLRRGNREDNNHPAHRLTLLYDDYHRVPPMLVTKAPAQA